MARGTRRPRRRRLDATRRHHHALIAKETWIMTVQAQMLNLFLTLGSEWVLHLLILLSVVSLAVALERAVHFVRHRGDAEGLRRELDQRLRQKDLNGARALLDGQRSHVAAII